MPRSADKYDSHSSVFDDESEDTPDHELGEEGQKIPESRVHTSRLDRQESDCSMKPKTSTVVILGYSIVRDEEKMLF